MDNQEIFDALVNLEEALFYRKNDPRELSAYADALKEMHETIRNYVLKWHALTGCHNM